jgi:hypothetical protein
MLWTYGVALSAGTLGRVGYGRRPTSSLSCFFSGCVMCFFSYVINQGMEYEIRIIYVLIILLCWLGVCACIDLIRSISFLFINSIFL